MVVLLAKGICVAGGFVMDHAGDSMLLVPK